MDIFGVYRIEMDDVNNLFRHKQYVGLKKKRKQITSTIIRITPLANRQQFSTV